MQAFTAFIARVAILAALAIFGTLLLLIAVEFDTKGESLAAAPYTLAAFALLSGAALTIDLAISSIKELIREVKRNRH